MASQYELRMEARKRFEECSAAALVAWDSGEAGAFAFNTRRVENAMNQMRRTFANDLLSQADVEYQRRAMSSKWEEGQ